MKKNWVFSVLAGLLIVGIGTAISTASVPDSNTGLIHGCYTPSAKGQSGGVLSVIDGASQECASGATALNWGQGPAVVAQGQAPAGCSYGKGGPTYCGGEGESLTFTPSRDAICQVTMDGQVISNGGEPDAKMTYGLAYSAGAGNKGFGSLGLSTVTGSFNTDKAATLARTANLEVEAGMAYTLKFQLDNVASAGVSYVNETYLCIA